MKCKNSKEEVGKRKLVKRLVSACICAMILWMAVPGRVQEASSVKASYSDSFANGADVSWVPAMESEGYKWYNKNGQQKDVLQILKEDYGINSIRLRTFVNPSGDIGNGWCDKENTIYMAKRAKELGMRIMIDFHYSDSWADPGKQTVPEAWKNDSFEQMMKAVYGYTYDVMLSLKQEGITPEWVQVGNETNNGMLWEYGRASTNMKNFAWFVNCGYDAVKAVSNNTKVIVHLANSDDSELYTWMFNGLVSNGAKFDVIGMSCYPDRNNWSQITSATLTNMQKMVNTYGKEIMICEVGMNYRYGKSSKLFVADMVSKVKSLPNAKGLGVFYWEPEAYPNFNGGYTSGACNSDGTFNEALEGFGVN